MLKVTKISAYLLPLLIWGLSGCATTTVIRPGEPFYHQGKAKAVTSDGRTLDVSSVLRTDDCLRFNLGASDRSVTMPVRKVKEVSVVSRSQGALQGLYLGPLIGIGAGLLLGFTPAGDCESANGGACIFGGPAGMALLLGVAGLVWGPILGGMAGKSQVYVFSSAAPAGDACPEASEPEPADAERDP